MISFVTCNGQSTKNLSMMSHVHETSKGKAKCLAGCARKFQATSSLSVKLYRRATLEL